MKNFISIFFIFLFFITNKLTYSNSTPGNTNIVTQTTLQYQKQSGETVISVSNYVVVKLNEITSFAVTNYLPEVIINEGEEIIIPYKISNHGNIEDSYIINVLNFQPFSEFEFFIDDNGDGHLDPNETTPLELIGNSFFKTPIVGFDNGINLVFKGKFKNSFNSNNFLLNLAVQSTLKKNITQQIQNNIVIQHQNKVKIIKSIFFDKEEKQFYFTFKFVNNNLQNISSITLEDDINTNFRISNYIGFWKPFRSDEKKAVTFFLDGAEKEDPNLNISLINNILKIKLDNVPHSHQTDIGGVLFIPFIVDPNLPENTILRNSGTYNFTNNGLQSGDFSTNEVIYLLSYAPKTTVTGDSSPEDTSENNQFIYKFTNTITNLGNNTDTFNVICKNSDFPGELNFTNITDSNDDGIPDTGPLAIGETKEIIFTFTIKPEDISNRLYTSNKIFVSIKNSSYIVSTTNTLNLDTSPENIIFLKEQGTQVGKYTSKDIEVDSTDKIYYKITLKNDNPLAHIFLDEIFDTIPENTSLSQGNGSLDEGGKPVYKNGNKNFTEINYIPTENKLRIKNITIDPNSSLIIYFNVDVS
ncbi:hypothetical protein [uncultured Cetobacterium sp.]|uniref:hypothetical protein n=1 Tax=uncultured Cetobacterium sp. TaxID=527638 RepID=UPI002622C9B0|nr:hypothetical protein [uncultured Cetobacterium sp.]